MHGCSLDGEGIRSGRCGGGAAHGQQHHPATDGENPDPLDRRGCGAEGDEKGDLRSEEGSPEREAEGDGLAHFFVEADEEPQARHADRVRRTEPQPELFLVKA